MKYKIYYDSGITYAGAVGFAPAWGVLVVVQSDKEHGRQILQNADYYVWDNRGNGSKWWECDFIGLIDYLSHPGWKKVIIGRLVENEVHQKIFDLAYADKDFLPKTGYSLRHHGNKA